MTGPADRTYWNDDGWHSRRQGEDDAFASYDTNDAVEEAAADGVEHIIKNQDGRIGERKSYANDTPEIPG